MRSQELCQQLYILLQRPVAKTRQAPLAPELITFMRRELGLIGEPSACIKSREVRPLQVLVMLRRYL